MKFKNMAEFNKFCDESMWCVCGRLMTGLHMSGCRKLREMRIRIEKREQKQKIRGEQDG